MCLDLSFVVISVMLFVDSIHHTVAEPVVLGFTAFAPFPLHVVKMFMVASLKKNHEEDLVRGVWTGCIQVSSVCCFPKTQAHKHDSFMRMAQQESWRNQL